MLNSLNFLLFISFFWHQIFILLIDFFFLPPVFFSIISISLLMNLFFDYFEHLRQSCFNNLNDASEKAQMRKHFCCLYNEIRVIFNRYHGVKINKFGECYWWSYGVVLEYFGEIRDAIHEKAFSICSIHILYSFVVPFFMSLFYVMFGCSKNIGD